MLRFLPGFSTRRGTLENAMNEKKNALPGQCILMLAVALDELKATEGEPDLAKVRIAIASVEKTLQELLELAQNAQTDS
jgi:hypothetical protein